MALGSKAYTTIKEMIDNPDTTEAQRDRYVTYIRRDEIPEAITLMNELIMKNEQKIAAAEDLGSSTDVFIARNTSLYSFKKILLGLTCKSVA